MNAALLRIMQKNAAEGKKHEATWVNPDAISVHAVVEGFIGEKGKLFSTKDKAVGAPRPKIRLTILSVVDVEEKEGEVKRLENKPLEIQVLGKAIMSDVAFAFARDGEYAVEEAKKAAEEEKKKLSTMSEKEKKEYRFGKAENKDKKSDPTFWFPVHPGFVIDVNIFNTSKILGVEAGTEVSIEGLRLKGSVWLKEPKGNFGNKTHSLEFSVFWDFTSLSFIKQHKTHHFLYEKIPAFADLRSEASTIDLEFDLTKESDEIVPFLLEMKDLELARCIRFPLRLSYESAPDKTNNMRGIAASLLPNESVDDFRAEKKEKPVNLNQDVEEKESHYIHLKSRMAVIPYKNNPSKELEDKTSFVYNAVIQISNNMVMRELGITRERYYTRIMEANSQSLEWEIIASFNSYATRGNKLNLINIPQKSGLGGNIIHRAKVASCQLDKFLMERGFHPSNEFVQEFFEHHMKFITEDVGYLDLKTANPYVNPNPMLHKNKGDLPANRIVVPLFCIQETAQDYLKPTDFTICAIASKWFAEHPKTMYEGMKEQHDILRKIGKLSQQEADKCLRNESDAIYPVGEDAVILIYAVRNTNRQALRVEKENEEEIPAKPVALPTMPAPKRLNRDSKALEFGDDESDYDSE